MSDPVLAPTAAASLGGPVSTALAADLREWVRRHGIVIWLDLDGHYLGFVERLQSAIAAGGKPHGVHAFRGSHLELMLALENFTNGSEKMPLVVHLPGFTEDNVRETPLLELYSAGVRYRKALGTLVTESAAGHVRTEEIEAFKAAPGLTLESADAWLAGHLDGVADAFTRQLRALPVAAVFDDLIAGKGVAELLSTTEAHEAFWRYLEKSTGLSPAWRHLTLPASEPKAPDITFAAAAWVLCVEYVDDLKRPPVNAHLQAMRTLPRPVIDGCRDLAAYLRRTHTSFYQRTADETEALLADEVEAARAEDLGRVDTFRFEEDKVLKASLAALGDANWEAVAAWADLRTDGGATRDSFWLRADVTRLAAWNLVWCAARLGQAIARAGAGLGVVPGDAGGLEAAIDAYVDRGAAVDLAHRQLEQVRVSLLHPPLPEFETLRAGLDTLRRTWREWADTWARDFNALCRANGFLPPGNRQQRTLFDEVVRPLAQETGATAYFVIDAFRYEMAVELRQHLEETPATTLHLRARLAELPTVTEVGMNVLAPISQGGRLTPVLSPDASGIRGFQAGEFRVADPESRKRAMQARVGGNTCPWLTLEDVVNRNSTALKRTVAQARLVVVHSREIDQAGEKGVGLAVFGHVMQRLRSAWQLLREAGVRRFVFTGDHGFLLLDDTAPALQAHGRRVDPHRRHVLSSVAADHSGEVRVSLQDLGYDGAPGHVMFPETIALFDTGGRPTGFAHGGNSLQERVIPVLTVVHRAAAGGTTLRYAVKARAGEGVAGMHCLQASLVIVDQGSLDFGSPEEIELALQVADAAEVQVELCQARGKARVVGGSVLAAVGQEFELFFRLTGPSDQRVLVELYHSGAVAEVSPCVIDTRFEVKAWAPASHPAGEAVTVPALRTKPSASAGSSTSTTAWLEQLPTAGVREVFGHLAVHGTVTEDEAAAMLGGPRLLRRFAFQFEDWASKAPFKVRIDVVAGVKRYVREGPA